MRLLVVEDTAELLKPLVAGLKRSGYTVEQTSDGQMALWQAQGQSFDLIILDIMLPGLDGLSVLRKLREVNNSTRVLLLTARDTVPDRVVGLRAGADDYLTKPFAFDELLARIEALLRRGRNATPATIQLGAILVDLSAKSVSKGGALLALTPREYAILEFLVHNRGRVVSRAEIEREVYDEQVEPMSNVVDSAICALRRKIDVPTEPSIIQTRRGHGYIIASETP